MPNVNFFPSRESDLLLWLQNYSTRISAAPVPLGLTAAQATALGSLVSSYASALAACAPDARNKSATTAKKAAATAVKDNARLLANIINGQATVTDAQKQLLGLNVRAQPQPRPVPATSPVIEVLGVSGWTISIRLRAADSTLRGKPPGVSGASIFTYSGASVTPPTAMSGWVFQGNVGRVKVDIVLPSSTPSGTKVFLTAFWFNGRKQSGAACIPISVTLQGGSVQLAA